METLLDSLIRFYATEIRKPAVVDETAVAEAAKAELRRRADPSAFPYLP